MAEDQTYAEAAMASFGKAIAVLFLTLITNGVPEDTAKEICLEWMRHTLKGDK